MKKFDTLKWIRQVRDRHHERQRNLSEDAKLAQTKGEAEQFRASRAKDQPVPPESAQA